MQALISKQIPPANYIQKIFAISDNKPLSINACGNLERQIVWMAIKLKIFYYSCIILRHPAKILKTFHEMLDLRKNVWGGDLKKMYKVSGRYYFNMYTPGWPS